MTVYGLCLLDYGYISSLGIDGGGWDGLYPEFGFYVADYSPRRDPGQSQCCRDGWVDRRREWADLELVQPSRLV